MAPIGGSLQSGRRLLSAVAASLVLHGVVWAVVAVLPPGGLSETDSAADHRENGGSTIAVQLEGSRSGGGESGEESERESPDPAIGGVQHDEPESSEPDTGEPSTEDRDSQEYPDTEQQVSDEQATEEPHGTEPDFENPATDDFSLDEQTSSQRPGDEDATDEPPAEVSAGEEPAREKVVAEEPLADVSVGEAPDGVEDSVEVPDADEAAFENAEVDEPHTDEAPGDNGEVDEPDTSEGEAAGEAQEHEARRRSDAGPGTRSGAASGERPRIVQPSILNGLQPEYPRRARIEGWEGTVVLTVTVAADGSLLNVRVREGAQSDVLTDAAIAAVEESAFAAGTVDGQARRMDVDIRVVFELEDDQPTE